MNHQIKITGEGTREKIADSLRRIADAIHHPTSRGDGLSVENINDVSGYDGTLTTEVDNPVKKFFWKDMSGRGYSSQITLEELLEMEDRNMSDLDRDEDDDEETLSEWAKEAEEGDTFTRNADHYTCIES